LKALVPEALADVREAATKQYSNANTFLHIAAAANADEHVLQTAIQANPSALDTINGDGRKAFEYSQRPQSWFLQQSAYLRRYTLRNGREPIHQSSTCTVFAAFDEECSKEVALKLMRNEEQFKNEVKFRAMLKLPWNSSTPGRFSVMSINAVHVPQNRINEFRKQDGYAIVADQPSEGMRHALVSSVNCRLLF